MAPIRDIGIEVTYAEPHRAIVKAYRLADPATIDDALRLAAADPDFAGIDLAGCPVGIFGKVSTPDQALTEGDRVEIYRPLATDPKSARRARARRERHQRGSPQPR